MKPRLLFISFVLKKNREIEKHLYYCYKNYDCKTQLSNAFQTLPYLIICLNVLHLSVVSCFKMPFLNTKTVWHCIFEVITFATAPWKVTTLKTRKNYFFAPWRSNLVTKLEIWYYTIYTINNFCMTYSILWDRLKNNSVCLCLMLYNGHS